MDSSVGFFLVIFQSNVTAMAYLVGRSNCSLSAFALRSPSSERANQHAADKIGTGERDWFCRVEKHSETLACNSVTSVETVACRCRFRRAVERESSKGSLEKIARKLLRHRAEIRTRRGASDCSSRSALDRSLSSATQKKLSTKIKSKWGFSRRCERSASDCFYLR